MMPDNRSTVLVIDDTPTNLSLLNQLLREHYRVKLANNGQRGLALAEAAPAAKTEKAEELALAA